MKIKLERHSQIGIFNLILVATLLSGCGADDSPQPGKDSGQTSVIEQPDPSSEKETVELTISFNGRQKDKQIMVEITSACSVLSVLQTAQQENAIRFESRGAGETAFVTSFDGVENEQGSGDNWVYRVNRKLGNKSAGLFEINPGDKLDWTFGKYSVEDESKE